MIDTWQRLQFFGYKAWCDMSISWRGISWTCMWSGRSRCCWWALQDCWHTARVLSHGSHGVAKCCKVSGVSRCVRCCSVLPGERFSAHFWSQWDRMQRNNGILLRFALFCLEKTWRNCENYHREGLLGWGAALQLENFFNFLFPLAHYWPKKAASPKRFLRWNVKSQEMSREHANFVLFCPRDVNRSRSRVMRMRWTALPLTWTVPSAQNFRLKTGLFTYDQSMITPSPHDPMLSIAFHPLW